MVRGKSLASGSGKGPHSGHRGRPACVRAPRLPAEVPESPPRRCPVPASAPRTRVSPPRSAGDRSLRDTAGAVGRKGRCDRERPDSDPSQLRPGRAPWLSPLRRGEGRNQDCRARLGPASFGGPSSPLVFQLTGTQRCLLWGPRGGEGQCCWLVGFLV